MLNQTKVDVSDAQNILDQLIAKAKVDETNYKEIQRLAHSLSYFMDLAAFDFQVEAAGNETKPSS